MHPLLREETKEAEAGSFLSPPTSLFFFLPGSPDFHPDPRAPDWTRAMGALLSVGDEGSHFIHSDLPYEVREWNSPQSPE